MKLSVIIPVYNEQATIKTVIKMIDEVNIEKEIIVVDDGSNDGTRELLHNLNTHNIKTLFHAHNRGHQCGVRDLF